MKLRHLSDLRALAFLAALLTLFVLHWTGTFRSVPSYLATFPLAFVATVICHNHIHLGLFRGRWANDAFSILLSFATGNPPTSIITAHNVRHHRHCDTEHDFVRSSHARFRRNWLNLLVFPLLAFAAMRRERRADAQRTRTARPRLYRQALRERVVFLPAVVAALVADPGATLVYVVAPWLFGQYCIVGINLVQHQGCERGSAFDGARNITGRPANWLLFNAGFHTAHHMRPGMHWSRLPAFHRRAIAPHIDPALNHRTLLGAIVGRIKA